MSRHRSRKTWRLPGRLRHGEATFTLGRTPCGAEHDCPRAPLTILRLRLCVVKKNIGLRLPNGRRRVAACAATWARPLTTWEPGSKKRPGLPFEANPLPSWASFPLPNGISMQEQDGKWARIDGTQAF